MEMLSKEEIGANIRTARETEGFSRPALSDATGIPVRSIEKYEAGEQEPSMSRIGKIAVALGVTFEELTGVAEAESVGRNCVLFDPTSSEALLSTARTALTQLDHIRQTGLHTVPRRATAMIGQAVAHLSYLDATELEALATDRELYQGGCEEDGDVTLSHLIGELFGTGKREEALRYCGNVVERLLDTAVLGVDLWGIEYDALTSFGEELDRKERLDAPVIWWNHSKAVPIIREGARLDVIVDGPINFSDLARFPRR